MIDASLTNADSVRQYLAGLAGKADTTIRDSAADITDRLYAAVDRNLSGGVLKSRTGTLRASLVVGSGEGIGGSITATAPYAAFQEYGFSGTETVRAHLRARRKGGSAPVRAYSRKVDYPAHSFLRSALAEMAPDIRQTIADAVAEVLNP
jgi:phage gpG-like protein